MCSTLLPYVTFSHPSVIPSLCLVIDLFRTEGRIIESCCGIADDENRIFNSAVSHIGV